MVLVKLPKKLAGKMQGSTGDKRQDMHRRVCPHAKTTVKKGERDIKRKLHNLPVRETKARIC